MKPIQSSPSEHAGDLLPAFASKGGTATTESFQAALALAIHGMGRIVAPPTPPPAQAKVPQTAAAEPAEHAESSGEPVETKPVSLLPTAVARPSEPIVPIEQDDSDAKKRAAAGSTPAPAPPAEVMSVVAPQVLLVATPVQGKTESEEVATPDSGPRTPMPQAPHTARPAAPVRRSNPVPSAELPEPDRHVAVERESPAPEPHVESRPAVRDEPTPVPARVRATVEEINVEGKAPVAPLPVKDKKLQRDVEAVQQIAESPAGAPHPEGVPAQTQRASHESPASGADAPAQLRHADDAPANPGTMDRVTLHLPDDAGGGRIQIAVRGDVVHARIVSADEAGTMQMQSGLDELRGALTRQGFQETHVRVETRPASDAGWMPASAAREAAGAGDSRPHDSERQERQARDQRQPEEAADQRRQQADGRSHQRSRRERER